MQSSNILLARDGSAKVADVGIAGLDKHVVSGQQAAIMYVVRALRLL